MRKYGNLLIIDDELDLGEILVDVFQPHFEKVIYCSDSTEAIGVTKSIELSAIITDVNMPNLPGDQFVRKIRSAGDLTPIVFLTGEASKELVLTALRLGVSDVFEKPFDGNFLVHRLDRILEIEKRKRNLFSQTDKEKASNEKKLLGLLHVISESKQVS